MPAPAPTPYVHGYSYTAAEVAAPADPKSGGALDADFYAIVASINSVIAALADVRRADGTIASSTVYPSSLSPAVVALLGGQWTPRGLWATTTTYAQFDLVQAVTGGGTYLCAEAHTSGVFNTDVAAGKWLCLTPVGYGVTAAIQPADVAETGYILKVTGADTYVWNPEPFGPVGFRNRIINGRFTINQRSFVSGAALLAGEYGHDRWKGGAAGATYTFAAADNYNSINITAGTLVQVIEGASIRGGTDYYLSWSGTAQARVNGGAYQNSPIMVAGLVGGVNVTIEFKTGTVALPQFEQFGATTFEERTHGFEVALCERYYQVIKVDLAGYTSAAQDLVAPVSWRSMRAAPTATTVGPGTVVNVGSSALETVAANGARFRVTSAGAGQTKALDTYYALDAEL